MFPRSIPFVLSLFVLAASGSAQRVFVIDGLNRPGTSFTDLPAAEAAARDGDTFDVRSDGGPYTAISTSKGITILGNFAAIVATRAQPFEVSNLPAGKTFVLQRVLLTINQLPAASLVELHQCQGTVHLEEVTLADATGDNGAALVVDGCRGVTVRGGRINGSPAIRLTHSTVSVSSTQIYGGTASAPFGIAAGVAIEATSSTLDLSSCYVRGGSGAGTSFSPVPALTMAASVATVGGPAASLRAGDVPFGSMPVPVSAVVGQQSLVRLDPAVVVATQGGAPGFSGVTSVTANVPSLVALSGTRPWFRFENTLATANVTLFGLPAAPIYGGGVLGALWLAPASIIAVPGALTAGVFTPQGFTYGVQVLSVSPSGLELSNPVFFTSPY